MSEMQRVHNLHMAISYDQDHSIYRYIERCADKSKNFKFDRKSVISINRFCRYDMSIQLLKKTIFPTKESFLLQLQASAQKINFVSSLTSSIKLSLPSNPIFFALNNGQDQNVSGFLDRSHSDSLTGSLSGSQDRSTILSEISSEFSSESDEPDHLDLNDTSDLNDVSDTSDVNAVSDTSQDHHDPIINRSVRDCYLNDVSEMSTNLDVKTDQRARVLIKEYEDYVLDNYPYFVSSQTQISRICEWVFDKYEKLRILYESDDSSQRHDSKTGELLVTDVNVEFISTLLFLGTLEWFHLMIIGMMVDRLRSESGDRCILIPGEETTIEHEHMAIYSMQDIRDFFSIEYSSHATVYVVNKQQISIFDPDGDDKKNRNDADEEKYSVLVDKLCLVLEKEYVPIDLHPSIQTLTDDQYCIFHCIAFILRLIEMIDDDYSTESFHRFIKYVDDVNKITKVSDVLSFAKNLELKAQFFI